MTAGWPPYSTFSGMIARLFNARTGSGANLVSYASVGVGVQDLIGGHVNAMVADVASTAQLVKQGRLRMLATTSAKRVAGWDAVPSLAELLSGFEMVGWFAVVAPAVAPQDAIARVNRDVSTVLADKEVAERMADRPDRRAGVERRAGRHIPAQRTSALDADRQRDRRAARMTVTTIGRGSP